MPLTLVPLAYDERKAAVEALGYSVDADGFIIDTSGEKHTCKYSGENVRLENAAVLPGSTLVINATPYTMAQYFLEYDW